MIDPRSIDLADLLVTWYGAPSRDERPLPASCDWLPEPLKKWHTFAARWDVQLTSTTVMISPEKVHVADDGMATFMVDATGDWRWCVDPAEPDLVFDAERYEPWERSSETLSELLVHNTVREVVYGARAGKRAVAASDEVLSEVLATMDEISFGPWRWPVPGFRTFMGSMTIAEAIETSASSGWDVDVVAPTLERLSHLDRLPGVHWRTRGQ
ncbi:MAG TPA: hypothetical protein VM387_14580 [Gemmatimonadales bacterium]|nr:hypothetical protein [Gemmatimonadales bacterium]